MVILVSWKLGLWGRDPRDKGKIPVFSLLTISYHTYLSVAVVGGVDVVVVDEGACNMVFI